MIKSELVQKIANRLSDIPVATINAGVNLIIEQIVNAVHNGNRVELRGFGSFAPRLRQERIAFNPKTKDKFIVSPKNTVHFKPGRELKACITKKSS